MSNPAFWSATELGTGMIQSAHYDNSMEIVSREVIPRSVVIIIHIKVAGRLQLNDAVGQFIVLPRTTACQS